MVRLRDRRQGGFVCCILALLVCTFAIGALCVFMPSSKQSASQHASQAQFYYEKNKTVGANVKASSNLLTLSEASLVQALMHDPYNTDHWNLLASVTQESGRYAVAHKARRFSHLFWSGDDQDDLIEVALYSEYKRH